MRNNWDLLVMLSFALLVSCEQERVEDTRALHPYSGDEPVLFAFLRKGATTVEIEAQLTLPFYSTEASADLTNLTGRLFASGNSLGAFFSVSEGRYAIDFTDSLSVEETYYLDCEHPTLGDFRTAEVSLPLPLLLSGVDTVRQNGALNVQGFFGRLPAGISVSSKLLRYGEGNILNNNEDLLPLREAHQPQGEDFNVTTAYRVRTSFVVFDQETLMPADTLRVDSFQVILYTWGEEVLRFNRSLAETGQEFGDGGESIDGTGWSNVEGGHGLVAGFSTDTVTILLP